MANSRQALGRWGEDRAAEYLIDKGYEIIERNIRTEYGEIDILARLDLSKTENGLQEGAVPGSILVFVEVKTRSSSTFGYPEQAVNSRKMEHMLDSAQSYLQLNPELGPDWRIDVIAIRRYSSGRPAEILHFENAAF